MRLIDADDITKRLHDYIVIDWNQKAAPYSWAYAYADIIEEVERTPTVDAAPVVHGRWFPDDDKHQCGWVCSNCLERACRAHDFCPNCGAKMAGEVET